LFGSFSVADCMFAPIASRFKTYDPEHTSLTPTASEYLRSLESMPEFIEWELEAALEGDGMKIPQYEIVDDNNIPMTL